MWIATAVAAVLAASTPAAGPYPAVNRPVAAIVSPHWGDAEQRDRADEVGQLVSRLGVTAGMTVADIGAGDGYDSLRLARIVGPQGSVMAEDVTPSYLETLRRTAAAGKLSNLHTVLGAAGDPKLARQSIDVAIMVHMYHEISQPYALLARLAPAFRKGGRLGIEELDRPTQVHGTPPQLLTCELAAAGYRRLSLSPLQGGLGYLAIFSPPTAPQPISASAADCKP